MSYPIALKICTHRKLITKLYDIISITFFVRYFILFFSVILILNFQFSMCIMICKYLYYRCFKFKGNKMFHPK